MPIMRSGYRALVNAVWGLVAGGVTVAQRTVTTQGGTITSVGTVTGNVNGSILGNVNGSVGNNLGNVGGDVIGNVRTNVWGSVGKVVGNVDGSVLGNVQAVNGDIGGNLYGAVVGGVGGNVNGSVNSVVQPVTVAAGARGTIRRTVRGSMLIPTPNTEQVQPIGATVVEGLTQVRFGGTATYVIINTEVEHFGDGTIRLQAGGVNLHGVRSQTQGNTYILWELTEMYG